MHFKEFGLMEAILTGHLNNIQGYTVSYCIGLFEMIVGVLTTCHLVLQMQPHVISFYGITSRILFMFLLFPQVSWKLKVRIRTAIETITADMLQTVWNELDYRVDVCRTTKGAHIEHL